MKFLPSLLLSILILSACGPVTPVGTLSTSVPQEYQDFSYQMVWAPDDSMIALTTNTGLYVYDTKTYKQLAAFDGLGGATALFSKIYLAAVIHEKVFVWKLKDFSLLFSRDASHETFFPNVAISPDEKTLVTAVQKQVRYWSLPVGALIAEAQASNFIFEMAFSEKNTLIIADPYLGKVQEWDVQTQKQIRAFGFPKPVATLNLSQDGELVVVDYEDGWRYAALNSDGSILAASNNEGYVYFYDTESGEKIGELLLPYKFTV